MKILAKIFSHSVPRAKPDEDAKRLIQNAKILEERTDRLYERRTGHPIGDLIERRVDPLNTDRGMAKYAIHY